MTLTKLYFNNLFNRTNTIVIGGVIISALLMLILCGAAPKRTPATYSNQYNSSYSVYEKTYTTITVESDDTLWSIATNYCKSDNSYLDEFIGEIVSINSINNDVINEGQRLMIPIY